MTHPHQSPPPSGAGQFRPDINGLRAWAVAAVVLFHFHAAGFAGGFVGVDVFFVISGFLMTGIVVRALESGTFSLWQFYMARAKRILPALLAVLVILLALGYFLLLPPDYRVLGTHSFYSVLFITNVKFWQEAGYFDTASHEKWLLHTWSLSVEWQFYLILPVVLLLAWRLRPARSTMTILCACALAASLAASIWLTGRDSSGAFFLLHTRAWEMLAGGLVFLLGHRLTPQAAAGTAMAWVGLTLIALSIALFDGNTPWPGWRAMLPVLGAMLVLAANRPVLGTTHPVMQWLGDRSYSIYLWHWPIVVALAYAGWHQEPLALTLGVLASLGLGAASYSLVEQPSRRLLGSLNLRQATLAVGAAVAWAALPAIVVRQADGVVGRFPAPVELAASAAFDRHPDRSRCHQSAGQTSPGCVFGAQEPSAIVIGDSHVASMVSAVAAAGAPLGKGVQQWSYDGCIYLPSMRQVRPERFHKGGDCDGFNRWVSAQLRQTPRNVPVILAGRYARYAMGPNESGAKGSGPEVYFDTVAQEPSPAFLKRFGDELTAAACTLARERPVYMVRPVPEMPIHVPNYVARRMAMGLDGHLSVPMEEYRKRNDWVLKAQDEASVRCGVRVLDPLPLMCAGGRCVADLNGRPLYYDHGHLSEFGNKLLVPIFRQVFGEYKVATAKVAAAQVAGAHP